MTWKKVVSSEKVEDKVLRLTKTMRNRKLISRNVNPLGEKTTKLIQTSFGFKIKGVQKNKKVFYKGK